MSDSDRNRHFSRQWTAPVDDRDPPVLPEPKTLENLSLELMIDWRRARQRPEDGTALTGLVGMMSTAQ
jgi:hypothetical protein